MPVLVEKVQQRDIQHHQRRHGDEFLAGVISGGMIPKVDCCVEAVRSGVDSAIILDGRVAHSILIELLSDAGIGTMLVH